MKDILEGKEVDEGKFDCRKSEFMGSGYERSDSSWDAQKVLLCCVELNFRLVHFQIANSLEAAEIARLLFEGLIANYGSCIEIHSDRGKSFLNKVNHALFTLGSIHHRLSNAYHPQSLISEGLAVRKFSSAMKAII